MRRPSRRACPAILAGLLATLMLFVTSVASATVVVPLTRAQLVERSELVVRAVVVSRRSAWSADGAHITTLTRLRVVSYMKGAGPQELVLRQIGGEVSGLVQQVPGDAQLSQGQDVVLFLRRGDGVVFLTALAQAAYLVQHTPGREPTVRRDLHELTFATPTSGQMVLSEPPAEPEETLAHLERDVAALVGRAP